MGIFAILLSLVLLIYLAYRGVSVLVLAPLLAMLAVLISGDIDPLAALTATFMPSVSNYIKGMFPVFLTGAIFGKIMGVSGASQSIALFLSKTLGKERAILATVLATALLTYGGVSLFVVVFAMYPIGASLFREAGIPKRILPGAIALGAFTFTMTAMPGSPQSLNAMPIPYFDTNTFAAPMLGLIGSALMLGLGLWYLGYEAKRLMGAGEGYGDHPEENFNNDYSNIPPAWAAFLPLGVVFVVNAFLTFILFKNDNIIEYYNQYGFATPDGTWSVIIGLVLGTVLALILYRKQVKNINKTVFEGANGALLPLFNTAVVVGYGGVIRSMAAFATIGTLIGGLKIAGLFKVAIATTLLAGVVGSSSGGTGLALGAFATEFLSYGVNPQVLHRVMIMAAGGLDTFPHSGAIVTLLAVCHITPKQGYKYIGVNTMLIPLIATFVVIVIHLIFPFIV